MNFPKPPEPRQPLSYRAPRCSPLRRSAPRRGQTRIESAIALALFLLAALGAWLLYKDQIKNTTQAMWESVAGGGTNDEGD